MNENHRFRHPALLSIALALAAAAIGCSSGTADVEEATASAEAALTGGAVIKWDKTPAVYIYEPGYTGCSAVKISPHHLLTAAHCVFGYNSSTGRQSMRADYSPGASIKLTSKYITPDPVTGSWFVTTIIQTDVFPAFRTACLATWDCSTLQIKDPYPPDLVILTLRDAFPSDFGPAATLSHASVGSFAYVTGFGCEHGKNGGTANPPRLTARLKQFIAPDNWQVQNQAAFGANYYMTAGLAAGGAASLCVGDSGGGVFAGTFDAGGELVAINSGDFGAQDGTTTRDFHTRIDGPGVTPWIHTIIDPVLGNPNPDPGGYCSGAANMCKIHYAPTYYILAAKCEAAGGHAPSCEFPDAQTVCMKADLACAKKDLASWAALATQCQNLGGKTVQCGSSIAVPQ